MILYQAMIPLNPRTKKNNQKIIKNKRTGSLMVVQNDRYLQYERDAGWFLKKIPQPILACRKLEKMGLVEKTESEWRMKGSAE